MIKYGIASYHRPECSTAQVLLRLGIDPQRIILYINTEEDIEPYEQEWKGVIPLYYKKKTNVAGNRNNILDLTENDDCDLVILDDDIRSFKWLDPSTKWGLWRKQEKAEELEACLEETFKKTRELGGSMWGVAYAPQSKQFLLRDGVYAVNKNFQGGYCGMVDKTLRFDETYDLQDDYELNMRIIAAGGNIVRRNDLYAFKGKMAGNSGGCKEIYEEGLQRIYLKKLENQYRGMFKMNKDGKTGRFLWK